MSANSECAPKDFGDPDVTGFGVLISFGVSILMMLGTVIIGYLNQLLREERYNALDTVILNTVSRDFCIRKRKSGHKAGSKRIEDFESFVLTMSDQQLVTGFSLILAAYLIRYGVADLDRSISAYSYCMAVNLALFSCVTHLSSMTVLRSYHDGNTRLRNIRTVLMIVAIAFLIPQPVASKILDSSQTLRCALDELGGDTTLYWYDDIYSQTMIFATLAMIGMLVCGYLRRLLEMYFPRFRESPEASVAEICAKVFSRPNQDDLNAFNTAARGNHFMQMVWLSAERSGIRYHFALIGIIMGELRRSFFAEIVWLLFYFTFGLCQVCFFIIWGSAPGESDPPISFTPQFRQLLPIGMLYLPILSAYEAYTRLTEHKEESGVTHLHPNASQHSSPSSIARIPSSALGSSIPLQTLSSGGGNRIDTLNSASRRNIPIAKRANIGSPINLYRVCLETHKGATVIITWLMIVFYTALVLFAAVIFTGIIFDSNTYGRCRLDYIGYRMTLLFFVVFAAGLLCSILGTFSWVFSKRYRSPHVE